MNHISKSLNVKSHFTKSYSLMERLRARIARQYYLHALFSQTKCDLSKITIGPDYPYHFSINYPERLSIGNGTVINGNCHINALGGVTIGMHCHIGMGLVVFSSNHDYRSELSIPYGSEDILRPVIIGDGVWIGANVSIVPGATIGDGAVLGMGSVIRGNVPRYTVVTGNPGVVISTRNKLVFEQLRLKDAWI